MSVDDHQVTLETQAAYRSLGVKVGALQTVICLNSPRIAKATSAPFSCLDPSAARGPAFGSEAEIFLPELARDPLEAKDEQDGSERVGRR
ncbi:hypothetical protein [Aquabacterium sp. OR-4]|uniref:hypothetical protein n=1 Tax=Aquabacterium sp. OR-4 TaxID=2978127 RepID=UPI0021B33C2E|nr:hypothetical protein [Aquabacterium sp. OR-4]MDT7837212.1 hypothetical protein [Aquabacterium sp. OR-4]